MRNDVFYVWNSIPLNSEKSLSLKRLELNSLDLEDALCVVYPQLSFCGILQVLERLPNNVKINRARVYENYGYSLDSKLTQLLHILPTLPSTFLHWCAEHSLSPRDLFPLLSLPSSQAVQEELKKISALALSRNLGAQILELAVECRLLSSSEGSPLNATNGDEWLQQLKSKRYPQTLLSDSEKQKKMLALPWPKDFQLRWQRQGDRSGLEVKFFVSHEKELPKFTKLLQQTIQSLEVNNHDVP
jgi:hypothetical protein